MSHESRLHVVTPSFTATGTLAIVRTQPISPVPYTGTVEVTSGEIAEDLAVYMAESEQTNSAIALGVQINTDRTIAGAGGYYIQVSTHFFANSSGHFMRCSHII